jgi:hypothetical protein
MTEIPLNFIILALIQTSNIHDVGCVWKNEATQSNDVM